MRPLAVSLGAIAGANARYYGGMALTRVLGTTLPWATLCINVAGSLVLGLLLALMLRRPAIDEQWSLLIGTGFCASFTTFSTFAVELLLQAQQRSAAQMVAYTALSVGLGLAAAAAGYYGTNALVGRVG